jgi:hypothetical protein
MKDKFLEDYQRVQAENIINSMQLNHWSLVLIEWMIREQEQKLVASDLPVEGAGDGDNFWEELS